MTNVVVVGGGHNGLVTSFYLARAGLDVVVVEAQPELGGACKTQELIPGYRFSTCANWIGWWRPRIVSDLRLLERGVTVDGDGSEARILDGDLPFVWWRDQERVIEQVGRLSPQDAKAWPHWQRFWDDAADLLGPYLLSCPPSLPELVSRADLLGHTEVLETLLTTSLAALTDRFFETEAMRSHLGAPHDVGSLYDHGSCLVHAMAVAMRRYTETGHPVPAGYVRGGMGNVVEAIAEAASEVGATFITSAPVTRIVMKVGRVASVMLATGDELAADVVVSGTDPVRTLELVDSDAVPQELRRDLGAVRRDIAPLKLHCALSELPDWTAFRAEPTLAHRGPLSLHQTRATQELAFDQARRGELPTLPFMAAMTPSFFDDSLAPEGHHTTSIWSLYAPYTPNDGSWEEQREIMAGRMLDHLAERAPNFRDALVDYRLLTPHDLEQEVLLTRGNIHHVDISPSQLLWQRPIRALAGYRWPIPGLYGCGAGYHPYGEVSGAPGHNAAHVVLADLEVIDPIGWQELSRRDGRVMRVGG